MKKKKTRQPTKKSTRNKFEHRIEELLKKNKVSYEYESVKIPYRIEGFYINDFPCKKKAGGIMFIETKGHFRPEAKRKMVAVKRLHPELDIRLVFYSSNKTYIRWAMKHGFPFAIGTIPEEWINELV